MVLQNVEAYKMQDFFYSIFDQISYPVRLRLAYLNLNLLTLQPESGVSVKAVFDMLRIVHLLIVMIFAWPNYEMHLHS